MADRTIASTSGDGPTLEATSTEPPRTRDAGETGYAVGREVARGGMGRIVRADDLEIGRPVAIKELLVRSPGSAARFEREARLTARLQHPGILPIYEIGRWPDGTPYYAMRMVEGKTLREAIADKRSLAERLQLLPALIAAVDTVAYAHSKLVIHRDLSPNNVLVGAYGETVVIDWGLAKVLDSAKDTPSIDPEPELAAQDNSSAGSQNADLTVAGSVFGTIGYVPVEQANGKSVDARADVYTLGALLYLLLSGRPPYEGEGSDVLAAVRAGPPRSLAEVVPDAPRDLRSIVDKAMARAPEDRYPDASALAAELRRFQTGVVVHAHRYSVVDRIRRWARRRRGVLIGSAAAIVGATAAASIAIAMVDGETPGPSCDAAMSVDGVWDAPARVEVQAGFLATKLPYAPKMFTSVATALDGYAADLAKVASENCVATRNRTQSDQVGRSRSACLDERLELLRAIVRVLKTPTPALLEKGDGAVFELARADSCSEASARPAVDSPDPKALRAINVHLANSYVQAIAGEPVTSLIEAQRARDGAKRLNLVAKQADAQHLLGHALAGSARLAEADVVFRETIWLALSLKLDDVAAGAAIGEAIVVATGLGRPAEGVMWLALAESLTKRLGRAHHLERYVVQASSAVYSMAGNPRAAVAASRRALQLALERTGPDHPATFAEELGLGASLVDAYVFREAIPHLQRSQLLRERAVGSDHFQVAGPLSILGIAYAYTNQHAKAHDVLARSLAIRERANNPLLLASTLDNLADLYRRQGKLAEAAKTGARATEMLTLLGKQHPIFQQVATKYAMTLLAQGRHADARALLESIITAGADGPFVAKTHAIRAELALVQRAWQDAEAAATLSIAGYERTGGPTHPELWRPLAVLGQAKIELGKRAEARPLLDRANAIVATTDLPADDVELAQIRDLAKKLDQ